MNFNEVKNIMENDTKDYIDYAGTRREKSDRKIKYALDDEYKNLEGKTDKLSTFKKNRLPFTVTGNEKAVINHGGYVSGDTYPMKTKGRNGKYSTDDVPMTLYKDGGDHKKINTDNRDQYDKKLGAKNEKMDRNELKDANREKPKDLNDLEAVKNWFNKFNSKVIAKSADDDFINLSNKKFDRPDEKRSFMFNVGDRIKAGDGYNKKLNGKEYTIFSKAGGINWEFFAAIAKDGEVVEFRVHK